MNRTRPGWHLLTGDFPPRFTGGVSTWSRACAEALAAHGLPVQVHARAIPGLRGGIAARGHDRALSYSVRRIRGRRWNARQGALVRRHLARHLRPGDVVLASTWPLATELCEPCRNRGVRLVVTAHGSEVTHLRAGTPPALRRLAEQASFGAVSAHLAGILREHGIRAVPLPAPVDPAPPRQERGEGILTVARLTPFKGVDRVLRLGAATGWPVTVVGEGPEHRRLLRVARVRNVDARFLGRVEGEDLARIYRACRVVALLSRPEPDGAGAEGLGLVPLEAAAHAVPAVVSPTGGLPEAVGPGLVLPDPDDALDSAARLFDYLKRPEVGEDRRRFLAAHHGRDRLARALMALAGSAEEGDEGAAKGDHSSPAGASSPIS